MVPWPAIRPMAYIVGVGLGGGSKEPRIHIPIAALLHVGIPAGLLTFVALRLVSRPPLWLTSLLVMVSAAFWTGAASILGFLLPAEAIARRAIDAYHTTVASPAPHRHLVAVGAADHDSDATAPTHALTLRNIGLDGEVCSFGPPSGAVMVVVRSHHCPKRRLPVLSVTPTEIEAALPEGTLGP